MDNKKLFKSFIGIFLTFLILSSVVFVSDCFRKGISCLSWESLLASIPLSEENLNSQDQIIRQVIQEESAVIEVVETASPSVVSVLQSQMTFDFFEGPVMEESSIGTGFAVAENLIVTNRHVVSSTSAEYTIVDNQDNRYVVEEIFRDSLNDLALLKIVASDIPPLSLGDSDQIKVGQTVVAIGNALGKFSNTVTKGVVSGMGRGISASSGLGDYQYLEDVIQTDAALNPGNSGGPLLDLSGLVVGVNVAISQGSENIGFSIPSNIVSELLIDFQDDNKISRPFLGVTYVTITADLAERNDLPQGAYIREIVTNSAADKAGLKEGDIITSFDGVELNDENSLSRLILKKEVGQEVDLEVWRNGKTKNLTAVLLEAEE